MAILEDVLRFGGLLQQMITPRDKGGFELVGPIEIAIHAATPPQEISDRPRVAVMQGIASHPHGKDWESWVEKTGLGA